MTLPADSPSETPAEPAEAARAGKTGAGKGKAKTGRKGPTPFMAQYLDLKARHPDALLFFRMGDFYELFFEDAEIASAALGIALTARGEHEGAPIAMAGVPVHSSETYLARLIRAGHRVAVCEQLETPAEAKARGSRALVERGVVRLVTPGTLTEDALLPAGRRQAVAAVAEAAGGACVGLACADVSTGVLELAELSPEDAESWLSARPVREVLCVEAEARRPALSQALGGAHGVAPAFRPAREAKAEAGERFLKEAYGVAALDGLGRFAQGELKAAGLLLAWLSVTQAGAPLRLQPPQRMEGGADGPLAVDAASRRSLEITEGARGGRGGSLLEAVDRTRTGPGARLLADRLAAPSRDRGEIEARLGAVAALMDDEALGEALAPVLKAAGDGVRAATRLALGRGAPRDLAAAAAAVRSGCEAGALLREARHEGSSRLARIERGLSLEENDPLLRLADELGRALSDPPAASATGGGVFSGGWDRELDALRDLKKGARKRLAALEAECREETGISALKVKSNAVLGWFIECGARHAAPLMKPPHDARYNHRQTLASAVRFSTPELAELADRIDTAEADALARERVLWDELCGRLQELRAGLDAVCGHLAELDVACGLAAWALESGAVLPEIADGEAAGVFEAEGLRHPVVEAALRAENKGFAANDLRLGQGVGAGAEGGGAPDLLLVTGPNMAGKSTFLRQNALAVILAQSGAPVPARRCRLSLCDKVFSRVGASDDLARGRSTFMVEMVETAAILNQATADSFVILDEVGRGTSTHDGLALAWAAAEHLHDRTRCRTLFATHYHELTELADTLARAANASLGAKRAGGKLVFLHEVRPGAAGASHGIEVARMAGVPAAVLQRAGELLAGFEGRSRKPDALPLFAASRDSAGGAKGGAAEAAGPPGELQTLLERADPDAMSPKEALELVYRLKALSAKAAPESGSGEG